MKHTIQSLKQQQELVLSYVQQLQAEPPDNTTEKVIEYLRQVYSKLNHAINKLSGQNRIKEVKEELFNLGIDEEFLNIIGENNHE